MQVGHVLQRPDVGRAQDLVRLKVRGLAVVDGGRVEADPDDVPLLGQPPGRLRVEPGEVQVPDVARVAGLALRERGVAEVVRPDVGTTTILMSAWELGT